MKAERFNIQKISRYSSISYVKPIKLFREHAIFTSKNDKIVLKSFEGEEMVYTSKDTMVNIGDVRNYPVDF